MAANTLVATRFGLQTYESTKDFPFIKTTKALEICDGLGRVLLGFFFFFMQGAPYETHCDKLSILGELQRS